MKKGKRGRVHLISRKSVEREDKRRKKEKEKIEGTLIGSVEKREVENVKRRGRIKRKKNWEEEREG